MESPLLSALRRKRHAAILLLLSLLFAAAAELLPPSPAMAALLSDEPQRVEAEPVEPPAVGTEAVEAEEPEETQEPEVVEAPPLGKTGTYTETDYELLTYDTVVTEDYTVPKGETVVVQAGEDRLRELTYEVTYYDGEECARRFVCEEADCEPVTEILAVGTLVKEAQPGDTIRSVISLDDGSGYLLMASGDSLRFTAVKTLVATAYTAGVAGVGTVTATGSTVHVGCAAVDRSVIPLGTKLFVNAGKKWNYGMAKAEDVGVSGERIDLYMDSLDECLLFGRREATVYLLAK